MLAGLVVNGLLIAPETPMKVSVCLLWCVSLVAALGGQPKQPLEPHALLQRAMAAHGGENSLNRLKAGHAKTDGIIEQEMSVPFTQEAFYQLPDRMKEIQVLEVNNQKLTVIIVLNGQQGWISSNGKTAPLGEALLTELREAAYLLRVSRLSPLFDKSFDFSHLVWIERRTGANLF